jgi:hypothetical protein
VIVLDGANYHLHPLALEEQHMQNTIVIETEPGAGDATNPLTELGRFLQGIVARIGIEGSGPLAALSAAVTVHEAVAELCRDQERVQGEFRSCGLQPACEDGPREAGFVGGTTRRRQAIILNGARVIRNLRRRGQWHARALGGRDCAPRSPAQRRAEVESETMEIVEAISRNADFSAIALGDWVDSDEEEET